MTSANVLAAKSISILADFLKQPNERKSFTAIIQVHQHLREQSAIFAIRKTSSTRLGRTAPPESLNRD